MDENGIGVPYWWIHHDPRLPDGRICPLEFTGEPIECRLAYIRNSKPPREIPTRERWMRPVIGALPLDVVRAGKAFAATQKVFTWISAPMPWINLQKGQEISEARANAHVVLDSILTENHETIMALFRVECPGCPWDENQGLIFLGTEKE